MHTSFNLFNLLKTVKQPIKYISAAEVIFLFPFKHCNLFDMNHDDDYVFLFELNSTDRIYVHESNLHSSFYSI